MNKNIINIVAYILVIVGALNWGLVGFANWNVVSAIFGEGFARVIYAVVGLAAVWMLYSKCGCSSKGSGPQG
jgi:hypothetical protein